MNLEVLIENCIANDRTSQRALYNAYKDNLYTVVYRITGDVDASSDLLQETFIDAFKNLSKLKERKHFFSWIKKILVRKTFKYLEKQRYTEDIKEYEQVQSTYKMNIETDYIEQAIQQLPYKSRTVFVMCAIEGFSHKEIAESLNISIGTSKSQLNYAKTKLKDMLKEHLI